MSESRIVEGIGLSERETELLAFRLLLDHVHYRMDDWLLWEDVPELGEHAFERLVDAVAALASRLRHQMRTLEVSWDIDTSELLERVQRASRGS